jgi:hypothetical protein
MAYIGVPQPSRAITSADIAQGAVTLNDISFTDVPANMDISGTIDKHTMRLAEGVTVTGDITISDNLILSKISDDGVGITLTNDSSTRTITGSGSIEASTLAQTPNASLTGMTGALGSEVTGTIGSGVTGGAGLTAVPAQTGNQVLISTQTASNVSGVAFSSSLITDTYDDYILDIGSAVPVTDGADCYVELSPDNGSATVTVYTGRLYEQLGGTQSGHSHNSLTKIVLMTGIENTASAGGFSSRIIFHSLRNGSQIKHGSFFSVGKTASSRYAEQGGFEIHTSNAINWINYKFSSGNVSSGRFNLYGIKK